MRNPHQKWRRGSVTIEFVLVSGLLWAPLIYFMATTGFRLSRSMELAGLVNDVSQMFARGVDFSLSGNQTMLMNTVAASFALQSNGGNAVTGGSSGNLAIVLSQYFYVNTNDPSCNNCTNKGYVVLERRIILGNNTLIGTQNSPASVGSIPGADLNTTTGTCETADNNLPPLTTCQYTLSAVRVSNASFQTIMTNLPTNAGGNVGGTVYLCETYFTDLTGRMIYQRFID
jgi:hypothetical protein